MDFYRLIAKRYDELYGDEQSMKYNIIKENLEIKNSDLMLDVGCGTGHNFNCKVVGMDPSTELLQQNNIIEHLRNKIMARADKKT